REVAMSVAKQQSDMWLWEAVHAIEDLINERAYDEINLSKRDTVRVLEEVALSVRRHLADARDEVTKTEDVAKSHLRTGFIDGAWAALTGDPATANPYWEEQVVPRRWWQNGYAVGAEAAERLDAAVAEDKHEERKQRLWGDDE